jgi:phosphoglycolate phosphatase-like HAD superfamily hydrolase
VKTLILFDLDGVITSEDAYWDAAGLTLHELLYSPRYWNLEGQAGYHPVTEAAESRRLSRATLPEAEILRYKSLALNSNWDTCYAAVSLRLIAILAHLPAPARSTLFPLRPWDQHWLAGLRNALTELRPLSAASLQLDSFSDPLFAGAVGLDLLNALDACASQRLGHEVQRVFSRLSPFWDFCREIFQEWYLGEALYTQTAGHAPAQAGKPGCIHFEEPLLPPEEIRRTLLALREAGYLPGFATGRVYQEALVPLKHYGLFDLFEREHCCTYDAVEEAEAELRRQGDLTLLSKPHPFQFLYALDRERAAQAPTATASAGPPFIVVGDSSGDMLGGRAAGALTVATLSGARTAEARARLLACEPDFVIPDVTHLPPLIEEIDRLATIQRLQFSERRKAEYLLRLWFTRHLDLAVEQVTLTPRAVSLNSFNGTYQQRDETYFFKTHVEEQGVLAEYYHAELLHQAGYHIVRPLRTIHQEGRQMVIYPLVHWPVMFDLVRAVETGTRPAISAETLIAAERRACERLLEIYHQSARQSSAEEHATAPVHQLFWHRITGGRLASFYRGKSLPLPGTAETLAFDHLSGCHWIINGRAQERTLGELLEEAEQRLSPHQPALTVIGHGDAHFGNVFLEDERDYLYFDPAFAGRHAALLDVIKPLFHNVFASWMYFPGEVSSDLQLEVTVQERIVSVRHTYQPAPIRQAILAIKVHHLLRPLLSWLAAEQALPVEWKRQVALALLCCPLLTINLLDQGRIPPAICWLGLTQAVELGNEGLIPWHSLSEETLEEGAEDET